MGLLQPLGTCSTFLVSYGLRAAGREAAGAKLQPNGSAEHGARFGSPEPVPGVVAWVGSMWV